MCYFQNFAASLNCKCRLCIIVYVSVKMQTICYNMYKRVRNGLREGGGQTEKISQIQPNVLPELTVDHPYTQSKRNLIAFMRNKLKHA